MLHYRKPVGVVALAAEYWRRQAEPGLARAGASSAGRIARDTMSRSIMDRMDAIEQIRSGAIPMITYVL